MGLGEACFFVGATTMVTDLAPVERRGEAVSYWSVALWGGLAFGPVLGEALLDGSNYDLVWCVAGGARARRRRGRVRHHRDHTGGHERPGQGDRAAPPSGPASSSPPRLIGITGFSVFLPLYAPRSGIDDVGLVFLVYGVVVLGVRIFGAAPARRARSDPRRYHRDRRDRVRARDAWPCGRARSGSSSPRS